MALKMSDNFLIESKAFFFHFSNFPVNGNDFANFSARSVLELPVGT